MIEEIILKQREYFNTGETKSIKFRKEQLKKLKNSLDFHRKEIFEAFKADFNKCEFDVIATELGMVNLEIEHMLKKLSKLSKAKKVRSNLINFPSKGFIINEPYGVVLIMSPWNYPLQLSLMPLVGAIAAGNTVVLKPSNYSKNVSKIIETVLNVFNSGYISVVLGGREENAELLDNKFDFIFFTGGSGVGKLVMQKASAHLTPVLLELGGKSPCIVDNDADLELAAKRIAWGKFLNCGQTCVAPDYVIAHKDIKIELVEKIIFYVKKFYYIDNVLDKDFPFIINDKHAKRLTGLIDKQKVVFGGKQNGRILEPTIMDNVLRTDAVMQEEIFGPILPVLDFDNLDLLLKELKTLDKPLALYYFSKNKKKARIVMNSASYGGGCINDVVMHLTNPKLPFGGAGMSGMGSYHGNKSFEIFSHQKSVFIKGKLEFNVKFPPHTKMRTGLVRLLLKIKKNKEGGK